MCHYNWLNNCNCENGRQGGYGGSGRVFVHLFGPSRCLQSLCVQGSSNRLNHRLHETRWKRGIAACLGHKQWPQMTWCKDDWGKGPSPGITAVCQATELCSLQLKKTTEGEHNSSQLPPVPCSDWLESFPAAAQAWCDKARWFLFGNAKCD